MGYAGCDRLARRVLSRPHPLLEGTVDVVGLALLVLGVLATLLAQTAMGASCRIGVDEAERTDLITGGIFAIIRHPVFTAMVLTQVGLTLTVPTAISGAALACLVSAVQLQVRVVEGPHLRRVHGAAYDDYLGRTGRFLPGIGRSRRRTSSQSGVGATPSR